MTLSYDFSEAAEGGDFVTLDPGRYVFKVTKAKAGESGAGNPKVTVTLEVAAGNPAYEGGIIQQDWPITGAGAFRFRSFLKALDIDPKERGKINLAKHYGKEVGAIVRLEEGNRASEDGTFRLFHQLNGIVPGSIMRAQLGEDDEFEDDEFEDEEEIEDEELEDEEEDLEDEEEEDDEEEVEVDEDYIMTLDLAELKELAAEVEVSTRKPRGSNLTKTIMRKRFLTWLEEQEEDADDEDDNDDEEPF